jgi:hypothetical protein
MENVDKGLPSDGKYLVSSFYPPIATSVLSNTVEEVPQEEFDLLNSGGWEVYNQEKEELENSSVSFPACLRNLKNCTT